MATDTRTRMIETTTRLLQARGVHGTSLNDVLDESGAPRGSLYYHFPGGKDQLVAEATRAHVDAITDFLRECFAADRDLFEAVDEYFRATAEEARESSFVLGCPVAPLILDSPEVTSELERLCRDALDTWHAIIAARLRHATLADARADALATLMVAAVEGGLILARSQRNVAPLLTAGEGVAALLQAALDGGGGSERSPSRPTRGRRR